MRLKPFFTYYGGKHRIAKKYPAPLYAEVIEPFAGSAGYSTLYHDRKVLLIDSDPVIAGVWEYLLKASEQEILSLPTRVESVDDVPGSQEARWLVGFWLNKGTTRPSRTPSAWMRSGVHEGQFWGEKIQVRIASQLNRIRHWRVKCGECYDAPDAQATWFVDPPYEGAGKHYRRGSDGIDYSLLGDWCKDRHGQVIVCENEGAQWLPFEPFCFAKANESKTGGKRSAEAMFYLR